jgi:hypothetical protein
MVSPQEEEPTDLTGRWRFIRNEIIVDAETVPVMPDNVYAEWTYFYYPNRADLVFTQDSLYRTEYPIQLYERDSYKQGLSHLSTSGTLGDNKYFVKDDTLVLFRHDEGNFMKELFKKELFEDSIMSILKADTINYPLLEGIWYLQRSYNYGNDGSEYFLNYPHVIPDEFTITREQILATMHHAKSVNYLTDGKMRSYTYGYDGNWLTLKPRDWYKGEDVILEFERKTW